jgi:hypothetical protein
MSRNALAAAFFAVLLVGLRPAISSAGDIPVAGDDSQTLSLSEAASQAGTAAGIVNQCRSDAAPIQSAFVRALDKARLDPARRQSLWQRYEKAESTTIAALAGQAAIRCADANGIIQDTIQALTGPLS